MSEQLMLFTEGFPVSPSAWQEGRKDKTIHDSYGRNFRGWSVKLDRVGLSLKMYLEYCVSQQTMYAGTWSVKDTAEEKESFLWRTPDANCSRGANSKENYERRQKQGLPLSLNDQVAYLFPTPLAHDAHGYSPADHKRHTPSLAAVAGGNLNPEWIEWLMGFPIGWTDLKL